MENKLTVVLPFSKKTVVITDPPWGVMRQVNREARDLKLDSADTTQLLLSKICTVDGEELTGYKDFDTRLSFKDFNYLCEAYTEWNEPVEKESPNGPATGK